MEDLLAARATLIFLGANVLLSLMAFSNEALARWGVLNTAAILRSREYHRLLVSGFLHANPMHLFFNMLTLFFFGPPVEFLYGSQSFFLIYLGALIGGNLVALYRHRTEPDYSALGASGAVSGIIFAYCLYAPFSMMLVFFFPIPAIVFAVLFVAYSLYGMGRENSLIGHDAHLGGAVIGLVITLILYPGMFARFISQIASMLG